MPEFEISQEIKNPLFNRNELELKINAKDTPTKKQVLEFISKKYSSDEDSISIECIKGKFGSNEFKVIARVYSSKEERELTEIKTQKQRKAEAEALARQQEEKVAEKEAPQENPTSAENQTQ
jgi:ribosomal protein S24E